MYATLGLIPANSYFNPAAKDEIALAIGINNAISQKWSVYVSMMNYDSGNGSGIAESETIGLEYRYGEQLKLDFYFDTVANAVMQLKLAL